VADGADDCGDGEELEITTWLDVSGAGAELVGLGTTVEGVEEGGAGADELGTDSTATGG
jgi:hypothetical protein